LETISGIPIINNYKYLGIDIINKLKLKFKLEELAVIAEKYTKLLKILNYQKVSIKYIVELFKNSANLSLDMVHSNSVKIIVKTLIDSNSPEYSINA
jgi:hypothetical protein